MKFIKENFKLLIICFGIIIFSLIFSLILRAFKDKEQAISKQEKIESTAMAFSKNGTLSKNIPGLKPETWYLNYSASGLSTVNFEINFNYKSLCKTKNKTKKCDQKKLVIGQKVKLDGKQIIDGSIIVTNLEY